MAYTYGARIDDDSYALTMIDEDQGTATTKGEINGVPFEGGGGSSDLSIATVTLTTEVAVAEVKFPYIDKTYEDIEVFYSSMPSGRTNEYLIPLYKNGACMSFNDDQKTLTLTGTGSVEFDGTLAIITGDCTITIS